MLSPGKIALIKKTYIQTRSLRKTASVCSVAINTVRSHCQDIIAANKKHYPDKNSKALRPDGIQRGDNRGDININKYNIKEKENITINNNKKDINNKYIYKIDNTINSILNNFNDGTYDLVNITPYQAALIAGILIDKKIAVSNKLSRKVSNNQSVIFNIFGSDGMKGILEELRSYRNASVTSNDNG